MVKRTDTMVRDTPMGAPVRIDGVNYWAGEDLRAGQFVEVGRDNLVRGVDVRDATHEAIARSLTNDVDAIRDVVRQEEHTRLFVQQYIDETKQILDVLECAKIDEMVMHLASAKTIYVVGLGGSAATASHAANDLRKLCGKNAICPTDNASLMTALINDSQVDEWLVEWLELQGPRTGDEAILFLSVGGGNGRTSRPLVRAAQTCRTIEGSIPVIALVGRDGGELARLANCSIIIPNLFPERVTPHVEGLASVLLHLLVSHPALAKNPPTWRT